MKFLQFLRGKDRSQTSVEEPPKAEVPVIQTAVTPYNTCVGVSVLDNAPKDSHGNPLGSQYDLAKDGSFRNYRIVLLNFCPECDFSKPAAALKRKGFQIIEYRSVPSIAQLKREMNPSTQLWLISDCTCYLSEEYVNLIADFFNCGYGVYLWGDNDPYFADCNPMLQKLFHARMSGNYQGTKILGIQKRTGSGRMSNSPGIIPNHMITTGLVNFYEGITIANISISGGLEPLVYSSDSNVVAAYYNRHGKRLIADGGFTRLYYQWESAGTDRYVVNAACWLANIERFGYRK